MKLSSLPPLTEQADEAVKLGSIFLSLLEIQGITDETHAALEDFEVSLAVMELRGQQEQAQQIRRAVACVSARLTRRHRATCSDRHLCRTLRPRPKPRKMRPPAHTEISRPEGWLRRLVRRLLGR